VLSLSLESGCSDLRPDLFVKIKVEPEESTDGPYTLPYFALPIVLRSLATDPTADFE